MPAADITWVKWFIRDWFMSRARYKLSPEARLAYLEIIWLMYESDDGHIDADADYLAKATLTSEQAVKEALKLLNPHHAERFTHHKVQSTRKTALETKRTKKRAAKSRWHKEKASTCNADAMLSDQIRSDQKSNDLAKGYSSAPLKGQKEYTPATSNLGGGGVGEGSARALNGAADPPEVELTPAGQKILEMALRGSTARRSPC